MSANPKLSPVLRTALPVSLANTSETVGLLVDAALLAPFGVLALAASGVAASLLQFFQFVGIAIGLGAQAAMARDHERANAHLGSGLVLALTIGLLSCFTLWAGHGIALRALQVNGDLRALAWAFLRLTLCSLPLFFITRLLRSSLTAACQTAPVAAGAMVSIAFKVIGDLLLLARARNATEAIVALATATMLAAAAELVFLSFFFYRTQRRPSFPTSVSSFLGSTRLMAKVGITALVEFGMWQLGTLALTRLLASASPLHLALYHVGMRIQSFFLLAASGFGASAMTYCSRGLGAQNFSQLIPWRNLHVLVAIGFTAVGAATALVFPKAILGYFLHTQSTLTASLAYGVMGLCAFLILVRCVNQVGGSAIRSLGHVPYFFSIQAFSIGVMVPVTYGLLKTPTVAVFAAFIAMALDEGVRSLITWNYFNYAVRRLGLRVNHSDGLAKGSALEEISGSSLANP